MMRNKKWIPYPRYLFRKTIALELIKKYVPSKSYFLEIGGGAGDFSRTLVGLGFSGKAIDFSDESYQIINELSEKINDLQIEKKDLFNLSEKEMYDFIVMFEVLEHISDEHAAVQKINTLLKKGRYALISVPAKKKLWDQWDEMAGHTKRYEKDELQKLLQDERFKIIRFYSYGFPFLNILKLIRNRVVNFKNYDSDKTSNTKKSGINIIRIPIIGMVFNEWTLYPFIQISKFFHSFDLAEGYLCLIKKL